VTGHSGPPGPPLPGLEQPAGVRPGRGPVAAGQAVADPAGLAADRLARAQLTGVAEPGDPRLGALLRRFSPAMIMSALTAVRPVPASVHGPRPGPPGAAGPSGRRDGQADLARLLRAAAGQLGLDRALARWAARLPLAPARDAVAGWQRSGIGLLCPGDPGWPGQLDVLGDASPVALWLRGTADLRFACLRSVSIVGTRAATTYGQHVAVSLAAGLAERGWTVISGGALGIDGRAHRGALAAGGSTIAVLPSGVDEPYPRGHYDLFEDIAAGGLLVSEWPPGRTPTRPGFLVRNRVIAALSRGTVVVEAALRSGALNTARHARDLGRPLMAVPGPVTSAASAGCHLIVRDWGGGCVTGAADVAAMLSFGPEDLAVPGGPVLPRDALDPVTRDILEAVPARGGWGPARIAVTAGVNLDTVLRGLGELAAGGFVERGERGWRVRKR
jgi:DNA processing protein